MALILASSSAIRTAMLEAAGVEHQAVAPDVDEAAVKAHLDGPEQIAGELAALKAAAVSAKQPDAWVVGSDSVVNVAGRSFDKPRSRNEAAEHLRFFSGKTMSLTSGVALARGGAPDWRHVESAELQVRTLSADFIEDYLDVEWPEVAYCVGVFRIEGHGIQLFDRIDGNHFTILGMPLLPLLAALRERGIIRS